MEKEKLISTYGQSKADFLAIKQELKNNNTIMRELKKDPKVEEYHKLALRQISLWKRAKKLKDELPWQAMLTCNHMIFPSSQSPVDYEGRVHVDYSCCRCGLTSMFNDSYSRPGDYFYRMRETYLEVFRGFYPPPSMRITNTIYPYVYMQQLYQRAIKIVGNQDRDKIVAKIFELEQLDKAEKEKGKQKTQQCI